MGGGEVSYLLFNLEAFSCAERARGDHVRPIRQGNVVKIAKYTACRWRGKELLEETEEEQQKGDMLAGKLDRVSES